MPSKKDEQPKKKQQIKSNDKLFDYFAGTMVNIMLNDIVATDKRSVTSNLTVEGLLLDYDDDYVYLGNMEGINSAIKRQSISIIVADVIDIEENTIDVPPGSVQQ